MLFCPSYFFTHLLLRAMSWHRFRPSLVLDCLHYHARHQVAAELVLVWLSKWKRVRVMSLYKWGGIMKSRSRFYRQERLWWLLKIPRMANLYSICLWGVNKAHRYVVLRWSLLNGFTVAVDHCYSVTAITHIVYLLFHFLSHFSHILFNIIYFL